MVVTVTKLVYVLVAGHLSVFGTKLRSFSAEVVRQLSFYVGILQELFAGRGRSGHVTVPHFTVITFRGKRTRLGQGTSRSDLGQVAHHVYVVAAVALSKERLKQCKESMTTLLKCGSSYMFEFNVRQDVCSHLKG